MPPKKTRKTYDFGYKLGAVKRAEEIGNRATARELEVDESMIRKWRKNKQIMEKMPKKQRSCRRGKAKYPALERSLKEWVVSLRNNGRAVTTVMIRLKARELATQMNLPGFTGGPSWCHRFMRRNKLSVRTRTTVGQKLPDDWQERVEEFNNFLSRRRGELGVDSSHVFNMDEVPMSFDAPLSRTVDEVGAATIPISTTGHEKTGFTVVLACSEAGKKLKPMVIFKRKTMPKENLPNGVVVHVQQKGWMDRDGMIVWANKVWRPRPVSFFERKSLLILDSFSAHIDEGVLDILRKEHLTTTAVIPGGLTKKLQPLDISVNRSFKNHVRYEWEKWMTKGMHTYTNTGKMRKATLTEVCNWVIRSWNAVEVSTITNGFKKAGITTQGESESEPEDEEEDAEDARLDPVADARLLELFNSDTEDEDFDGF